MNKNKSKLIFGLFILFLLVLSAGYFLFNPVKTDSTQDNICNFKTGEPISIHQLAKCDFKDGDVVEINGTIASVETFDTNYDSYSVLKLEGDIYDGYDNPLFYLLTNKSTDYNVGDVIQMTLHLEEIQINGNKLFAAEELGIHLILPSHLRVALDATSAVAGIELVLKSTNGGITEYEVFTNDSGTYSIDLINVTLRKGSKHDVNFLYATESMIFGIGNRENYKFSKRFSGAVAFFSSEYVYVSGGYIDANTIDFMESLNDSISENGYIEFVDVNLNGLIDDYDIFKINITPTADKETFETYLLLIGTDDMGDDYNVAAGVKYILNWYDGVFEGTHVIN